MPFSSFLAPRILYLVYTLYVSIFLAILYLIIFGIAFSLCYILSDIPIPNWMFYLVFSGWLISSLLFASHFILDKEDYVS